MNTTLLNVTRLNVTEMNVTRLNSEGLAGMGKKGGGMEAAIRRSMVLWYDIARQGCTNESMAANPVLKDLSGNGHDATCYNFAWTEESGISSVNYPNALVADGVDDYAYVEGMPILTDHTIITNRNYFSGIIGCLAAKYPKTAGVGAFKFEIRGGNPIVNSFGSDTYGLGSYCPMNGISYMTKSTYNGIPINVGNNKDGVNMSIFNLRTNTQQYATVALYSLLLFDRTLSQEEIEWVKENLIEGKTITM